MQIFLCMTSGARSARSPGIIDPATVCRIGGMKLSVLVWVGLALAVGLVAGIAEAGVQTRVVAHVTPFAASGALRGGLSVTSRRTGMCEPGSDSLASAVYRCFSGNRVLDPCWRESDAPHLIEVVCLLTPWAKTVTQLTLKTSPAPTTGTSSTDGEPWGLELANGQRCIAFQGSHDTVNHKEGGIVIDYLCGGTLVLLRGIDRSSSTWTIRAARARWPRPDALVGSKAIEIAWFGGNHPNG